jgi:hypothetical protein
VREGAAGAVAAAGVAFASAAAAGVVAAATTVAVSDVTTGSDRWSINLNAATGAAVEAAVTVAPLVSVEAVMHVARVVVQRTAHYRCQ